MTTTTAAAPFEAPPADEAELAPAGQRGSTEIADRVVEQIAARAAAEVDDAHGPARRLLGLRVPGVAAPKVTVQIDGHLATVRLAMSIRYPAPIRQVTRQVREHVCCGSAS